MGKPAARAGDMHLCPMVTPGTPPIPHIGGPIPMGCPTVLIGGMMAARMGDPTAHGGMISIGLPTVLIGEVGSGQASALTQAAASGSPLCEICS